MTMPYHDDLHHRRIEPELLKAWQELRLRVIGRERVDHKQSVRRPDHICNRALISDHIYVVENFGWLDRRIGRTVRARSFTEKVFFLRPTRTCHLLRLLDKRLHGVRVRLRGYW